MESATEDSVEGGGSKAWGCLAIGAFLAAAFFYLFATLSISSLGGSDPAGNGMAAGFAALAEMAMWIALAAFVAIACKGAKLPFDLLWLAAFLVIGGAVACMIALGLMQRPTWLRISPTLIPLLTAGFAAWARLSLELPVRTRRLVGYAIAIPAMVLIVIPFVEQEKWDAGAPAREAEYRRQQAESEAAFYAEFRAMGPDRHIDDFFPYIPGELENEAVAKIRTLHSRQADAVRLLGGEMPFDGMERMHEFELEPDATLCAAYRGALDRTLARFRPEYPTFREIPGELQGQAANFQWLAANDCDLRPQIGRLAAAVRSLPDYYPASYAVELESIGGETPGQGNQRP